jgi:hypothetical protein
MLLAGMCLLLLPATDVVRIIILEPQQGKHKYGQNSASRVVSSCITHMRRPNATSPRGK